ncbi:plasmid mobilization protein [Pseudomonas shirazica]|uniref:plasmid mobilization protein n=1 Tax=Pseudomonas putida group TaxID=136845 RepID=UPI00064CAF02
MKSERLELRLSSDDKRHIAGQAALLGVRVSDYVRDAACGRKVKRADELRATIAWLGRLNGNVHALARYANFHKGRAHSILILASLRKIESELDQMRRSLC